MEMNELASSIMEKMENSNCYFEVSKISVHRSIRKHLEQEYEELIKRLSIYCDIKIMSGESISDEEYDKEFNKIKYKILEQVKEIRKSN